MANGLKTFNITLPDRDHEVLSKTKKALGIDSWPEMMLKGAAALVREQSKRGD